MSADRPGGAPQGTLPQFVENNKSLWGEVAAADPRGACGADVAGTRLPASYFSSLDHVLPATALPKVQPPKGVLGEKVCWGQPGLGCAA